MQTATKKRGAAKVSKHPILEKRRKILRKMERATIESMIWEASTAHYGDMKFEGYLVTEPLKLDLPIAIVGCKGDSRSRALRVASRIATNPQAEYLGSLAIDLRDHSGLDSEYEMPGWVYGLFCTPLGKRFNYKNPNPYCRFRLSRMVSQFMHLRFPEESKQYPYSMIGAAEYPDGLGGNNVQVIAVAGRPIIAAQVKDLIGPDDANEYNDRNFLAQLAVAASAA